MNLYAPAPANKAEISPYVTRSAAPPFEPKRLAASRIAARFKLSPSLAAVICDLAGIGGAA